MNIRKEAIATLKLGGPLIAAQLAQISIGFVDTVMAGHLSARALAAVAVGANVWFTAIVLCIGLLITVSPSVAQLYGAGRHREIGHCVRQGLWLSQAAALLVFAALRFVEPAVHWLRVDPEIIPVSMGFLRAISCGLPAFCAYQVLRSFTEGVSLTRPAMYASVLAFFGNLTGDYILMYGKLGLPAYGAVGCGISSAIVMWLVALFMAVYIKLKPDYAAFKAFDRWEWPCWQEVAGLVRMGSPIAVSLFMEASMFGVVALLMGSMGAAAIDGHQIAINVAALTWTVPLGISMATTVRVGQAIGRGDPRSARFAGFTGISMAGAFMAMAGLAIFAAPELISRIYTEDPEVRKMAVTLLFMAAIFQIFDGLQVSGAGALRGLKDTKVPMFITSFAYWGIGMPLAYVLGITRGGGPKALWIGFIFGLAAAAILLSGRFHLVTRRMVQAASTTERMP